MAQQVMVLATKPDNLHYLQNQVKMEEKDWETGRQN